MAQEQKSIKGCVTLKNVGICYGDKNIFENFFVHKNSRQSLMLLPAVSILFVIKNI